MDDELTREEHLARVDARTTERVSQMSEKEREELARELRRRRGELPEEEPPAPAPEPPTIIDPVAARPVAPDPSVAARLTAELHATERRLDRLERLATPSRYQAGGAVPSARYYRLLSRAERIERKLRELG